MGKDHGAVSPELTDAQWDRLLRYGEPVDVTTGDVLFRSGDRWYDLILVESGEVEVVRDALPWVDESVIATVGPRMFVGELGLLNGQRAFLTARASEAGRMHRASWPRTTNSATCCSARCGHGGKTCGGGRPRSR